MKTLLKTTVLIFLLFVSFILSAQYQYIPPANIEFSSQQIGIKFTGKEWIESNRDWIEKEWIEKDWIDNEWIENEWIESSPKWIDNKGRFQTGKLYNVSFTNSEALMRVPGFEGLKTTIQKGSRAIVVFPSVDKMQIFIPEQKIKLCFTVDAKNKHIQMDN